MVTEIEIERETKASCTYLINERVKRGMSIDDAIDEVSSNRGYVRAHVTIALLLADGRNTSVVCGRSMSPQMA